MVKSKPFEFYEITLYLSRIQDLFQTPELDPFAGSVTLLSGMEQIISYLQPKSLQRQIRATIFLPRHQISAQTESATQNAIQRYCEARIQQIDADLAAIRWQGMKTLQLGMLVLAICLLLSALFEGLEALPQFLRNFLGEGFLIAGWVGIWYPAELLLFDAWILWRKQQLFQQIKKMELSIQGQD